MAGSDALKRLGGGRWETRDGRFQIEPQSGTWVIVDTTQTNEFGLPLVRGPFASLGAAKDAIESARAEGPVASPLSDRIEEVKRRPPEPVKTKPTAKASTAKTANASTSAQPAGEAKPPKAPAVGAEPPGSEPAPPPDPAWFRDLTFADRRTAKALIAKLGALDIDEAEAIAKAEMADGQPALAQLALERLLTAALARAKDPPGAAKATIKVILAGADDELGADWRLVDGHGRRIEALDIVD
jgi:hypothetical protein